MLCLSGFELYSRWMPLKWIRDASNFIALIPARLIRQIRRILKDCIKVQEKEKKVVLRSRPRENVKWGTHCFFAVLAAVAVAVALAPWYLHWQTCSWRCAYFTPPSPSLHQCSVCGYLKLLKAALKERIWNKDFEVSPGNGTRPGTPCTEGRALS